MKQLIILFGFLVALAAVGCDSDPVQTVDPVIVFPEGFSKTGDEKDYICSFSQPSHPLCTNWCADPGSNCLTPAPVDTWPQDPDEYIAPPGCWGDPLCDMEDYLVDVNHVWLAGHSYARNLEDMEDLGAEVSVYHGGEGFLSDWYDDYDNAIAPGLGYKHHVYIEWLQYASQLPASIASLTAIKDTLRFSNTPHVMQQWFQTAPACNTHGLTCGPDGQDDFTDLYNELSDSTGVDVIPVGEAFRNAYEAGVTTLHSDGTHASAQGEYLRNITIYGDLFDIDPRLMPTLGVTDASILQQAAFDAIQNQTH